jgi:hypothetical protein
MNPFSGKFRTIALGVLLLFPLRVQASLSMLVYGPTSGCYAETTPGFNVTVWSTTQWASATTAQFAAFNVIVFADCPPGSTDPTRWNTAIANESIWSPAVTGNGVLLGTDPDNHTQQTIVQELVTYAAADPLGRTGIYAALSQVYDSAAVGTLVPLLSGLGNFTVGSASENSDSGVNEAHVVAFSPAMVGITDATLSNWDYSVHEGFDSWAPPFQPLAIATDSPVKSYTAPDGTQGFVYMLLSGTQVTPIPTSTFTPTATPTSTPTVTPTPTWTPTPCGFPGDTCTPTPTITWTPVCIPEVWPDPFNPSMAVGHVLKINCLQPGCTVSIFTVSGESVLTPPIPESDGMATWNGNNTYGVPAATGIYFYVIQQSGRVLQSGKFLVVH